MIVRFWGVRGSHARPLTPFEIQNKISTIINTAKPEDMATPETRKRFFGLPSSTLIWNGWRQQCLH